MVVKKLYSEVIFMSKKKERGPQYYCSATNVQTLNYCEYYMSLTEKVLFSLLGIVAGGAVGYLFYGGIGKDANGNATTVTLVCNLIFCAIFA